jgi:hypothetical protein
MSKSMSNGSVEYHLTDSNEEGKIGSRIFLLFFRWRKFGNTLRGLWQLLWSLLEQVGHQPLTPKSRIIEQPSSSKWKSEPFWLSRQNKTNVVNYKFQRRKDLPRPIRKNTFLFEIDSPKTINYLNVAKLRSILKDISNIYHFCYSTPCFISLN